MEALREAGQAVTTYQIDYDEEVGYTTRRKLLDIARDSDERPFFLCASFIHPHDPYVARPEWWDLYDDDDDRHAGRPGTRRRSIRTRCESGPASRPTRSATPTSRPGGPPRLLRQRQLLRRLARPPRRHAGGDRPTRRHDRHRHERPRRHARRPGRLVQDVVPRTLGPGAARDGRPGHRRTPRCRTPARTSTCCRRCSTSPGRPSSTTRLRRSQPAGRRRRAPTIRVDETFGEYAAEMTVGLRSS